MEVRAGAGAGGWEAAGPARQTIGMQYLHTVNKTVGAVRVRCTKGASVSVSINALRLAPLEA